MTTNLSSQPPDILLKSVLQTSLDGLLLCKAVRNDQKRIVDFQVVWCNERAAAMVGMSQETVLNNSMLTLDPNGYDTGIFDKYSQVVETGLSLHIEHYFAQADVWMAQSLARFDGGVLASWADITQLKRAERKQQHETELLQAILDNTQTGVAVMQAERDDLGRVVDFRFTHLNPDAERITRRKRSELIGQYYSVAWPEAVTNGVLDWHIRVAQTGQPARMDGVFLPVGDYEGWYNVRIKPFGDGVIATFVDVTALKRAELANQQQADLLRSVLDNSSNVIIAFSAVRDVITKQITDFRYVAHNEANRQAMNRPDQDILGHTMLEFFPDMVTTGLFDRLVRVVESGNSAHFEQQFTEAGWAEWNVISVMKWGDGVVLTVVDITTSKNHQQQIEQTNRDLLNANENLRQFAYIASHDLQEPLRKIMAFGDMLEGQYAPQLDRSGRDIIARMQSAAGRMSLLIKDVLAYSRISTQRESFKPLPLNPLLTDVWADFMNQDQAPNGAFEVGTLPTVLGSRSQLRQVFINLIANALKFRSADRPVTLRIACRTVAGADGPPELKPTAMYHKISIQDNGIGFEPKYAERIFQVFQRLHSRQEYDGTGVGLAICKRIVENHHGAITATGQPGEGATFWVYLPA